MRTAKTTGFLTSLLILAVGSTGCSRETKRDRYLESGERYFQAGEYSKAELEFLNAQKLDRSNLLAIRRLGEMYYERGRLARAIPYLREAERQNSNDVSVLTLLGQISAAVNDFNGAREKALRVLSQQPTNTDAILLLTQARAASDQERQENERRLETFRQKGGDPVTALVAQSVLKALSRDLDGAEADLRRALTLNPRCLPALTTLGTIQMVRGNPKLAEEPFRKAAEYAPVPSSEQIKWAEYKLMTGAREEAKQIVEELTKKAPDYTPAWTMQAAIAFDENRFEDCEKFITTALSQDPGNVSALMLHVRTLIAQKKVDAGIAELKRIVAIYDKYPDGHFELGRALLLTTNLNETVMSEAVKAFEAAHSLDSNHVGAARALAEISLRRGKPEESRKALELLQPLASRNTNDWGLQLLIAGAYRGSGRTNEAIAVYRSLMQKLPDNAEIPYLLGLTHRGFAQMTEARDAFLKTLALAPDNPAVIDQLVELDLIAKDIPSATKRAEELVAKKPDAPDSYFLLGKVHARAGRWNEAEAALKKSIELKPDFFNAHALLAQVYVATKQNDQALARYNEILDKNPRNPGALFQVAMIHERTREFSKAAAAYEKILAITPNSAMVMNNLAYVYVESLDQAAKGYDLALKARQLDPNNPAIDDTFGWICLKRGNFSQALSVLRLAADKLPAEPTVLYHLGMAHYMTGDAPAARSAFQQALSLEKEFDEKSETQQRLAILDLDVSKADPTTIATLEKAQNDPIALIRLGALYDQSRNLPKAKAAYEKALTINPTLLPALTRLAEICSRTASDHARALELVKQARPLISNDPVSSHLLGRAAYRAGDPESGLILLQTAATRDRDNPAYQYDLAMCYYHLGKLADANQTMQRVASASPPNPESGAAKEFLQLTATMATPDQLKAAEPRLNEILRTQPDYLPARYGQALVQELRGDFKNAARLYEDLLKNHASFTPAMRNLAILLADRLGNDDRAYPLATKAQSASPNDAKLNSVLGKILYRRGSFSQAVGLLKPSVPQLPNDADALFCLGMSQHKLNQKKEARETLQQSLKAGLAGKSAEEAKRVLSETQ